MNLYLVEEDVLLNVRPMLLRARKFSAAFIKVRQKRSLEDALPLPPESMIGLEDGSAIEVSAGAAALLGRSLGT